MNMNDTGNRVIAGIVVVLLIIGAWYLGTTLKPGTGKMTDTKGSTGTSMTDSNGTKTTDSMSSDNMTDIKVSGDAVSVSNQPAGSTVSVSSVTLPQMGWVAVRDSSGRTLGAARLDAGTHEGVQVELLRNTVAGQSYQVLLYVDDGDKEFDLHKDTLVMSADGSVSGSTFNALNGD